MRMFSTRAVCRGRFVFLLLAAALVSDMTCLPQSDKPALTQKLGVRVPEGRIEGTFVGALGETARVFNIPMGISWVNTASGQQKRTVEYRDATVLEIVEDIAKTEPGYEVQVTDNVVHVTTNDVPTSQNCLYLNIPEFSGRGVAGVVKAGLWMLLNQLISPDPKRGYGGSIFHSASEPKFDLKFTNATVTEILDAIALGSDNKVWIVTFAEDLNLTSTGFRRSESFDSKTIPPDAAQPEWDIFRWDHWPVTLVPSPDKK
jgi:hypothetical protein